MSPSPRIMWRRRRRALGSERHLSSRTSSAERAAAAALYPRSGRVVAAPIRPPEVKMIDVHARLVRLFREPRS